VLVHISPKQNRDRKGVPCGLRHQRKKDAPSEARTARERFLTRARLPTVAALLGVINGATVHSRIRLLKSAVRLLAADAAMGSMRVARQAGSKAGGRATAASRAATAGAPRRRAGEKTRSGDGHQRVTAPDNRQAARGRRPRQGGGRVRGSAVKHVAACGPSATGSRPRGNGVTFIGHTHETDRRQQQGERSEHRRQRSAPCAGRLSGGDGKLQRAFRRYPAAPDRSAGCAFQARARPAGCRRRAPQSRLEL